MMQKKLFLFVVASALNYGSGMSIPPTTQQFNYSNGPFRDWFLSKFFGFELGEKISSTGIVVVKISKMSTFSSFCLT